MNDQTKDDQTNVTARGYETERALLDSVGRQVAAVLEFQPEELETITPVRHLPTWTSNLRVAGLAVDSVALSSLAMTLLAQDREPAGKQSTTGHRVEVDPARVQSSFGSDRVLKVNGAAPSVWAPLSGFWQAADGWVRTHGNYPHHAKRLLTLLGLPADAEKSAVAAAIRGWKRLELEDQAASAGALAIAVRDTEEWRAHPQHPVLEATPMLGFASHGGAAPRQWRPDEGLPLSGVRVIDLTRVIAGPVATRDLALAGAEVLRIDSPELPEPEWQHFDTGQGKRSTLLNLGDHGDSQRFERLLEDADVVVHGYRPSALAAYGLDAATLIEKHPGLVVAQLSAWGTEGPWGQRRGFDSLVQAASGIAVVESKDGGATPGALPVQALDHSAGHFLAAAIATALRRQRAQGGSFAIDISLARIALVLLAAGPADQGPVDQDPGRPDSLQSAATPHRLHPSQSASGSAGVSLPSTVVPVATNSAEPLSVECAPPVLDFPGAPTDYPMPLHPWGSDPAEWSG